MLEIEWNEIARNDLLDIIEYIAEDSPDAAQRLKDDIATRVAKLPEHPNLYKAGRIEGTREMVVWANYIVVYRIDASSVHILRVLHAAQRWPPLGNRG